LAKNVSAVLTPEKVDKETDERDNITIDMKSPANEYEFQKLNADFDRKLDHLSGAYKRKADEIFRADQHGLNMEKRRNRLWMWFDRKTKFRIFPKILLAVVALTVAAIIYQIGFGYDEGMAMLLSFALVAEVCSCIAIFSSRQKGDENPFQMSIDLVTNPAWKDLECNVYNRKDDSYAAQKARTDRALHR
jgi:hypothetical protein